MSRPNLENEPSKVTMLLRAMGNPQRMRILNQLAIGEELSVSELRKSLKTMSQSALSQHLGRLKRAGVVHTRRQSRNIYYSVVDADVLRVLRLLEHIYHDDPVMNKSANAA